MKRIPLSVVLTIILLLILMVHVNYLRFVCDDAFISFRYAKNFIQGQGLVYNIGERVEGYTNFLWTMLLSLFMGLGLNVVAVSQILGVSFSIATILLLLNLSRKLHPRDNIFNYLAPLFLVCCGAYAAWSTGGLETSFYTFLVFMGSYLFIMGIKHPRYLISAGIIFAFASMTRLDGLIFSGITFVDMLYLALFQKQIQRKSVVLSAICFLLPFLLYFLWRWSYYGELLPNTFYVKVGGYTLYHQGLSYLFDFVKRFWIWIFIIPLAFLPKAVKSNANLGIITPYFVSLVLVFSMYVVYVGGDFMDMFRFLVPVLPFFFFLVQEGFRGMHYYFESIPDRRLSPDIKHQLKSHLPRSKRRRRILTLAEISWIILSTIVLAYPSKESNRQWNRNNIDSIGLLREYSRWWTQVGLMFKQISKPGESLSTSAAGAIPFYSELYTIDELGLTLRPYPDMKFIKIQRVGHQMRLTNDFLAYLRPTYIVAHPQLRDQLEQPQIFDAAMELVSAGYKWRVIQIEISETETKYLYFLSTRSLDSD
jgi:arabinofuranosyltransferase